MNFRNTKKGQNYCVHSSALEPRSKGSGAVSSVEFIGWVSEPVKLVEALACERIFRLTRGGISAAVETAVHRLAA